MVHSDALLGSGLTKEHQACTLGALNSFRGDLGQRMLLNREGLGWAERKRGWGEQGEAGVGREGAGVGRERLG